MYILIYIYSDLEVEYSEEMGKLYYFKYKLSSKTTGDNMNEVENEDIYIPVATTRPETILGLYIYIYKLIMII